MKKVYVCMSLIAAIALVSVGLFAGEASATTLAQDWGAVVFVGEIAKALKQQRGELYDQLKALHQTAEDEDRDLNEEEQATFDETKAAISALDRRIDRAETLEQESVANMVPAAGTVGQLILPPQMARGPAPKHFDGPTAREDAYRSGMWIAAAIHKSPEAQAWCAEHGVSLARAGKEWFEDGDSERPKGALTSGVNTSGGFLVPSEFDTAIIKVREQYGAFRRWAEVVPMSSDVQDVPRESSELTAYPVGENEALTESEGGWDMVTMVARKWGVMTRWSTELNEDAIISMADDLAEKIGRAFAYAEDNAGFNGDGSSTYHGIVGVRTKMIDGSHDSSFVQAASGIDTFAEIDAATLSAVKAQVHESVADPRWYCSRQFKALVFDRLAMAAGGISKVEVGGKPNDAYDGDPVLVSSLLPKTTGDLSDVIMALYGDMRPAVKLGTRRGTMIATSSERYFELDQLAIKGTQRFDINAHTLVAYDHAGTAIGGTLIGLKGN